MAQSKPVTITMEGLLGRLQQLEEKVDSASSCTCEGQCKRSLSTLNELISKFHVLEERLRAVEEIVKEDGGGKEQQNSEEEEDIPPPPAEAAALSEDLDLDIEIDTDIKPYQCKLCPFSPPVFDSATGMAEHYTSCHPHPGEAPKKNSARYQWKPKVSKRTCPSCTRVFATPKRMRSHFDSVHAGISFSCPVPECDQTFKRSDAVKVHVRRFHSGEAPPGPTKKAAVARSKVRVTCQECGISISKHEQKRHMKIHTGADHLRHACQDCGKRFRDRGDLRNHMRRHTGEKPVDCSHPNCKRKFISLHVMRTHAKRVHKHKKKKTVN